MSVVPSFCIVSLREKYSRTVSMPGQGCLSVCEGSCYTPQQGSPRLEPRPDGISRIAEYG